MGGEMFVESTPEAGSKISFELTFDTINLPEELSPGKMLFNDSKKPIFEGEILVCEDNAMNQQVICEHLTRVGLQFVVAHNGKEGVDIIKNRIDNGEKPFDLILMDIYMPVMDGLEAAMIITGLQTGTPIIAMTANIMPIDKELYEISGLPDSLGKPFTSQELWRCLMKYLTPVSWGITRNNQQTEEDAQLRRELQINFVKNNQTTFNKITGAINENRIELAHRLAHTLKSNASQIGKTKLQNAAANVEWLLKDGKNSVAKDIMNTLETEITAALNELAPLLDENKTSSEPLDEEQILSLFEKLDHMLQKKNPECYDLLGHIRTIPGAEKLAWQVENFDFKPAIATLTDLKENWRRYHG
jgi:CheY-like chemotaxis protein